MYYMDVPVRTPAIRMTEAAVQEQTDSSDREKVLPPESEVARDALQQSEESRVDRAERFFAAPRT